MRVLLVPTTEGYGHASRAAAIISGLANWGVDYAVLTDQKRANFLVANGVDPAKIDSSFFGVQYVYTGAGKDLDLPRTLVNLVRDAPKYFRDYWKVVEKTSGPEKYDLVINDINLQLLRLPTANVITPFHSNPPRCAKDHRRIRREGRAIVSEYCVEPAVNAATFFARKFRMDFRPHHIDCERIFPPVISDVARGESEIRRELGIGANDVLILDGRGKPQVDVYAKIASEFDDVYFLVRSKEARSDNIRTMEFIPRMVNYINAADLFVTDTGFTSISEGAITKTPMLFADPGSHLEGHKNFSCAIDEGFGQAIGNLGDDLLQGIEGKVPRNTVDIPNGLPFLMEKIMACKRTVKSSPPPAEFSCKAWPAL
ncbi:MAG TPA: hypothetical protein VLT35_01035 [Methanocella sp.]|nr:hypothetical protein [Methanocella sp.]